MTCNLQFTFNVTLYLTENIMLCKQMVGRKRAPASSRRAEWWRLRQRWRMIGVFEIDPEHEFYQLTTTIKEGMQHVIQTCVDGEPQVSSLLTWISGLFQVQRNDILESTRIKSDFGFLHLRTISCFDFVVRSD